MPNVSGFMYMDVDFALLFLVYFVLCYEGNPSFVVKLLS